MLIEVDLRQRKRMCHSPYQRSSDGLLNGKDQKMAILVIKQQNCRKEVFISARGTVGGPGPRASIVTNAGNKGSLLGQKQTPKRGCFSRCRPSWKAGLLPWQVGYRVNKTAADPRSGGRLTPWGGL